MVLQITPVDRAALQMLAEGKNHVEIAARLDTSIGELKATLTVLFSRLGVRTPGDAISAGLKRGLLTADRERVLTSIETARGELDGQPRVGFPGDPRHARRGGWRQGRAPGGAFEDRRHPRTSRLLRDDRRLQTDHGAIAVDGGSPRSPVAPEAGRVGADPLNSAVRPTLSLSCLATLRAVAGRRRAPDH